MSHKPYTDGPGLWKPIIQFNRSKFDTRAKQEIARTRKKYNLRWSRIDIQAVMRELEAL